MRRQYWLAEALTGVDKGLAEFDGPLTDGLVADEDAAGRQHLLDHAKAERETEIQPDRHMAGGHWACAGSVIGTSNCQPVSHPPLASSQQLDDAVY